MTFIVLKHTHTHLTSSNVYQTAFVKVVLVRKIFKAGFSKGSVQRWFSYMCLPHTGVTSNRDCVCRFLFFWLLCVRKNRAAEEQIDSLTEGQRSVPQGRELIIFKHRNMFIISSPLSL